jgi:hypothetical protein
MEIITEKEGKMQLNWIFEFNTLQIILMIIICIILIILFIAMRNMKQYEKAEANKDSINSLQDRTDIIRKMIEKRILRRPMIQGDILPAQVKYLPDIAVWGCPEGMIFNIINEYIQKQQTEYYDTESEIIEEIEDEDNSFDGNNYKSSSYPKTLIQYIHYRLRKEYPEFDYLYTNDLITEFYNMLKQIIL